MIDVVAVALKDMANSENVFWAVSLISGERLVGKILPVEDGIYAIGNSTTWYFRATQVVALGAEGAAGALSRR